MVHRKLGTIAGSLHTASAKSVLKSYATIGKLEATKSLSMRWLVITIVSPSGEYLKRHASQWCHNEREGVSNHQPHDCLFNSLFRRRSKKTSKLRVTGLCEGYSPVTGEFPAQRASNAGNASIWWRHHGDRRQITRRSVSCPIQSIHILQWCNRWSLGMDKKFHPTLYWACRD